MQEKIIAKELKENDFCAEIYYEENLVRIFCGESAIEIKLDQVESFSDFLLSVRYRV